MVDKKRELTELAAELYAATVNERESEKLMRRAEKRLGKALRRHHIKVIDIGENFHITWTGKFVYLNSGRDVHCWWERASRLELRTITEKLHEHLQERLRFMNRETQFGFEVRAALFDLAGELERGEKK